MRDELHPLGTRLLAGVVLSATLLAATSALAQTTPAPGGQKPPPAPAPAQVGPGRKLSAEERIRLLEQKLIQADRHISQLAAELQSVKLATGQATGAPPGPTPGGPPGAPTAAQPPPSIKKIGPTEVAEAEPPPGLPSLLEEEETVEPVEEEPQFTPAFLREARAVLIRRGLFEVDTRLAFSHNDRNFIAAAGLDVLEQLFIGQLVIGEANRDTFRPSVSFRYGVADRLQLNANVPYAIQYTENFTPPLIARITQGPGGEIVIQEENHVENWNHGLGDIDFGFSYHLFRSGPYLPDTIVSFGVKTTTGTSPFDVEVGEASTGTGFWGLRGGATFVWVSDPASIFANIGYFKHFKDTVDLQGAVNRTEVDPADNFSVGAGIAYSLNPFLSISTQVNTRFVEEVAFDGDFIAGSSQRTAELALGVAYGWGRNRSIDAALSFGLTNESPDFSFAVSMPFTFEPWVPWKNSEFGPLRRVLSF